MLSRKGPRWGRRDALALARLIFFFLGRRFEDFFFAFFLVEERFRGAFLAVVFFRLAGLRERLVFLVVLRLVAFDFFFAFFFRFAMAFCY